MQNELYSIYQEILITTKSTCVYPAIWYQDSSSWSIPIKYTRSNLTEHSSACVDTRSSLTEHSSACVDTRSSLTEHSRACVDTRSSLTEHSSACVDTRSNLTEHSRDNVTTKPTWLSELDHTTYEIYILPITEIRVACLVQKPAQPMPNELILHLANIYLGIIITHIKSTTHKLITSMGPRIMSPFQEILKCHIPNITKAGMQIANTIQEVVALTRLEIGTLHLVRSCVNISKVIDNTVSIMSIGLPENIKITSYISHEVPSAIYQDADKIRDILIKLIENSVAACSSVNNSNNSANVDHQILISCHAHILSSPTNDPVEYVIQFTVSDNGGGIKDASILPLNPGFMSSYHTQASSVEKPSKGLGLLIARKYAQLLGGDLTYNGMSSTIGAEFTFEITAFEDESSYNKYSWKILRGLRVGLYVRHVYQDLWILALSQVGINPQVIHNLNINELDNISIVLIADDLDQGNHSEFANHYRFIELPNHGTYSQAIFETTLVHIVDSYNINAKRETSIKRTPLLLIGMETNPSESTLSQMLQFKLDGYMHIDYKSIHNAVIQFQQFPNMYQKIEFTKDIDPTEQAKIKQKINQYSIQKHIRSGIL